VLNSVDVPVHTLRHCTTTAFAQEWRGGAGAAGSGTMHSSTKSSVRRHNNRHIAAVAGVDAAAAELGMQC
jgi:hypothetical protein